MCRYARLVHRCGHVSNPYLHSFCYRLRHELDRINDPQQRETWDLPFDPDGVDPGGVGAGIGTGTGTQIEPGAGIEANTGNTGHTAGHNDTVTTGNGGNNSDANIFSNNNTFPDHAATNDTLGEADSVKINITYTDAPSADKTVGPIPPTVQIPGQPGCMDLLGSLDSSPSGAPDNATHLEHADVQDRLGPPIRMPHSGRRYICRKKSMYEDSHIPQAQTDNVSLISRDDHPLIMPAANGQNQTQMQSESGYQDQLPMQNNGYEGRSGDGNGIGNANANGTGSEGEPATRQATHDVPLREEDIQDIQDMIHNMENHNRALYEQQEVLRRQRQREQLYQYCLYQREQRNQQQQQQQQSYWPSAHLPVPMPAQSPFSSASTPFAAPPRPTSFQPCQMQNISLQNYSCLAPPGTPDTSHTLDVPAIPGSLWHMSGPCIQPAGLLDLDPVTPNVPAAVSVALTPGVSGVSGVPGVGIHGNHINTNHLRSASAPPPSINLSVPSPLPPVPAGIHTAIPPPSTGPLSAPPLPAPPPPCLPTTSRLLTIYSDTLCPECQDLSNWTRTPASTVGLTTDDTYKHGTDTGKP